MEGDVSAVDDPAMATDLDHVRRAKKLITILVDRFGVSHFVVGRNVRVNQRACEDAVALACAWIERRTGRTVDDEVTRIMRKDLRRLLVQRIGEGAAQTR